MVRLLPNKQSLLLIIAMASLFSDILIAMAYYVFGVFLDKLILAATALIIMILPFWKFYMFMQMYEELEKRGK